MMQVDAREAERRLSGTRPAVARAAPVDSWAVDVEAVVGARRRQFGGEHASHPSDAAADVEHAVGWRQPGQLMEVPAELLAGGDKVRVADEVQPTRGNKRVAATPQVIGEINGPQAKRHRAATEQAVRRDQ
ncbi:MAG TPA: hypothetical protein VLP43_04060 [Solirubrobacteraceae bacterium]|nr:hypothetical protein [Solirubrobacteraceae bacterium]